MPQVVSTIYFDKYLVLELITNLIYEFYNVIYASKSETAPPLAVIVDNIVHVTG